MNISNKTKADCICHSSNFHFVRSKDADGYHVNLDLQHNKKRI
jgi:hypothetical protein